MTIQTASVTAFLTVSAISAAAAIYDKAAAKTGLRRIPESTLLAFAALGGSAAMLLVMLLIRHKTRHPKFMAGIPVIMALQAAAVLLLFRAVR